MNETTTETTQDFSAAFAASATAETERKQAARPPRSFTEGLPCRLSDSDLLEIADLIAKADESATLLEEKRKEANDSFKAQIALAEQRRAELIRKVRTKTEIRDVECVEEYLFTTNEVRTTRTDTMEVVKVRAMTKHERQLTLDVSPPSPPSFAVDEDGVVTEDEPTDADDGINADTLPAKRSRRSK